MGIYEDIRGQAKLDSRRFGKGVTCRIVYGQMLTEAERYGLVPPALKGALSETGIHSVTRKMFVIPVAKFNEVAQLRSQASGQLSADQLRDIDVEAYQRYTEVNDAYVRALKQNLVLVTVQLDIPEGKVAGLNPEAYDVVIDSIDVNQAIEARYVLRNRENVRNSSDLRGN